jgi:hypothetical protein
MAANEPNHFVLTGEGAQLSYTTTGIDGQLRFNYEIGEYTGTARGDQIRVEQTEIGQLVTVTVATVPDLHTITLSVLLPAIHLGGPAVDVSGGEDQGAFQTQAVLTTHHTSFGGPRLS